VKNLGLLRQLVGKSSLQQRGCSVNDCLADLAGAGVGSGSDLAKRVWEFTTTVRANLAAAFPSALHF
jgi:hypothetical protein